LGNFALSGRRDTRRAGGCGIFSGKIVGFVELLLVHNDLIYCPVIFFNMKIWKKYETYFGWTNISSSDRPSVFGCVSSKIVAIVDGNIHGSENFKWLIYRIPIHPGYIGQYPLN